MQYEEYTARRQAFRQHLTEEEKSRSTVEKYLRDVDHFLTFLFQRTDGVTKAGTVAYKEHLQSRYAASSANSMLTAANLFLQFIGRGDCCVRLLKTQRRLFREESRELTRPEYRRLVEAARRKKDERLVLVIETICATGIRVSELACITAEAVRRGTAEIRCKGKRRMVFLPESLRKLLREYIRQKGITEGSVFRTRTGRPMDRSNIWHAMKALSREAGVAEEKVYPHNLRHLFARTFYQQEKDIIRLADILGHGSVETTRIYTISSGAEHARQVERLGLVV